MAHEECVFCRIIQKELPSFEIYSDSYVLAILDINPVSEGHTLVIPRNHSDNLLDVDPVIFGKMMDRARIISGSMVKSGFAEGTNIFIANGTGAEQTIPHLHVHLVPRRKGDGIELNRWWSSKVIEVSSDRMAEITESLRNR
ncbi:MAG: HIT family protein [Thermoplasmataceae archaeon]